MIAVALAAFWYHLFAGIRHLAWDLGYGFEKSAARATATVVLILAATGTCGDTFPDARVALVRGVAVSRRPGSASRHWRNQRMTTIALVPLGLWFLAALLRQPDLDHATVLAWLTKPLQAFLALLFGIAMLWHSAQGVQVVLEDYVGGRLRRLSIRLSQLIHAAAAATVAWATFVLVAGGAA